MSADDISRLNITEALEAIERRGISTNSLLTKYEESVVYHYSSVGYLALNSLLRTNLAASLPEFGQCLKAILGKLPAHEGMVYRSVTLTDREIAMYRNACVMKQPVVEPFFVSTSKSRLIAERYGNTLFRIICKSGRAIADYSKHPNEDEVLISCGSVFAIKRVDVQRDGRVVITMKEL